MANMNDNGHDTIRNDWTVNALNFFRCYFAVVDDKPIHKVTTDFSLTYKFILLQFTIYWLLQ